MKLIGFVVIFAGLIGSVTVVVNQAEAKPDQDQAHQAPYYHNDTMKGTNTNQLQNTKHEPVSPIAGDVHCIQTPANLQSTCSSLNWAPQTRLPNLLDHRSALELDNEITQPMTQHILEALANDQIQCKLAEQLKLLICSNLSPVCIDILVPPCKQLCIRARTSCRPALQRLGLEWPKFLDCHRFPMSTNDICLARQPPTINWMPKKMMNTNMEQVTTTSIIGSTRPMVEFNQTTVSPSTTKKPSSKRRRKEKKARRMTTKKPITTSTTLASTLIPTSNTSQMATPMTTIAQDPNQDILSQLNVSSSTRLDDTVTNEPPLATTSIFLLSTSSPQSLDFTSSTIGLESTTPPKQVSDTTDEPTYDLTSMKMNTMTSTTSVIISNNTATNNGTTNIAPMPTILNQDLIQTICQARPDWLIKTKITDGQLENAVKKRKFKVRSFRQIFGLFNNTNGRTMPTNYLQQQAQNNSTSARSETSGKSPMMSSVYLNLSNSTVLIFPTGPNLLTQSMSEPNPMSQTISSSSLSIGGDSRGSDSSASNNKSSSPLSGRSFLVFGVDNLQEITQATGTKIVSHIIMWPGAKSNRDTDSQASSNIVKIYRDFKLRGLGVCQASSSLSSPLARSVNHEAYSQLDGTTVTQVNGNTTSATTALITTNSTTARPPRTRKQQQHHGRRAQDKL